MSDSTTSLPPLVTIVSVGLSLFFLALFYEATSLRRPRPVHPRTRAGGGNGNGNGSSGSSSDSGTLQSRYKSWMRKERGILKEREKEKVRGDANQRGEGSHVPTTSNVPEQSGSRQRQRRSGEGVVLSEPWFPSVEAEGGHVPMAQNVAEAKRQSNWKPGGVVLREPWAPSLEAEGGHVPTERNVVEAKSYLRGGGGKEKGKGKGKGKEKAGSGSGQYDAGITQTQPIPIPGAAAERVRQEARRLGQLVASDQVGRRTQERLAEVEEDASQLMKKVKQLEHKVEHIRQACVQRNSAHLALREDTLGEVEDLKGQLAKLKEEVREQAREMGNWVEQGGLEEHGVLRQTLGRCEQLEEANRILEEDIATLLRDLDDSFGRRGRLPRRYMGAGFLPSYGTATSRVVSYGGPTVYLTPVAPQVVYQIVSEQQQEVEQVAHQVEVEAGHSGNVDDAPRDEDLDSYYVIPTGAHVPPPTAEYSDDEGAENDDAGSDCHVVYDTAFESEVEDNGHGQEHHHSRPPQNDRSPDSDASTETHCTRCNLCDRTPSPQRYRSPSPSPPETTWEHVHQPLTGLQLDGTNEQPQEDRPSRSHPTLAARRLLARHNQGQRTAFDQGDGFFIDLPMPRRPGDFLRLDDIDGRSGLPIRVERQRVPLPVSQSARRNAANEARRRTADGNMQVGEPNRQAYVEDDDEWVSGDADDEARMPPRCRPQMGIFGRFRGNRQGSQTPSLRGGGVSENDGKRKHGKDDKDGKRETQPSRSRTPSPQGDVPVETPGSEPYRPPHVRDPLTVLLNIAIETERKVDSFGAVVTKLNARMEDIEEKNSGQRHSEDHQSRRGSMQQPPSRRHLLESDWRASPTSTRGGRQEQQPQQQEGSQRQCTQHRHEDAPQQQQRSSRGGHNESTSRRAERGNHTSTVHRGGRQGTNQPCRVDPHKEGKGKDTRERKRE